MEVWDRARHPMFRRRVRMTGRRADGGRFPVEAFIALADAPSGLYRVWIRGQADGGTPDESDTANAELLDAIERLTHAAPWEWDPGNRGLAEAVQHVLGLGSPGDGFLLKDVLDRTHPGDRAQLTDAADRMTHGGELAPFELRVTGDDGELRYVEVVAEREPEDGGGPDRLTGIVRDVTEERLADQRSRFRLAVSKALSTWTTLDDSGPDLLAAITWAGRAVATMWLPDGDVLVPRLSWVTEDLADRTLVEVANGLRLPKGIGVAGWAWQLGKPVDGAMLPAERTDPLYDVAQRAGFKTAVGIPALAGDHVLAVIEVHWRDKLRINEISLQTLLGMSYEIGGVLSSRRGELGRNPLTARELEILKLAADGLTTPEIASRLVVERSTVRTHFEHIYAKLGTPDRAAAVAQALRRGLID
jgi:DNA-binding CsgD family transcriptional regulator/PAS domain-containing protein